MMHNPVAHELRRFTSKIADKPAEGCWEWSARLTSSGYGSFWSKGRNHAASRWLDGALFGPIPQGIVVRHSCDNPKCCRPSHLERGTQRDNRQDAVRRGRTARGERSGQAKLTDAAIRALHVRNAAGETQVALALEFGVTQAAVWYALRGRTWRHVA